MQDFPAGIAVDGTSIGAYNTAAARTDRMPPGFDMALLGLFGEVGSLLTELKKSRRDSAPDSDYEGEVIEELGDVLWYLCAIARRADMKLEELAQRASRTLADWDERGFDSKATLGLLYEALPETSSSESFESALVRLAGRIGGTLSSCRPHKFFAHRRIL